MGPMHPLAFDVAIRILNLTVPLLGRSLLTLPADRTNQ